MTPQERSEAKVPKRLLTGLRSALLEGITDGSLQIEQSELAKSLMRLIDGTSVAMEVDPGARSPAGRDGAVLLDGGTLILPAASSSLKLARQAVRHARSVVMPFEVSLRLRLDEKELDELEELLANPIC